MNRSTALLLPIILVVGYFGMIASEGTKTIGILSTHTPLGAWIPSVISLFILGAYLGFFFNRDLLEKIFVWTGAAHFSLCILLLPIPALVAFLALSVPLNYMFEVLAIGYLIAVLITKGVTVSRIAGLLINSTMLYLVLRFIVMNTKTLSF